MIFRQLRNPESSSFTYIVGDKKRMSAVIIDPVPASIERDLAVLREVGLKPEYVLLTHQEPEHENAANTIRERTGARLARGQWAAGAADLVVKGGDVLKFGLHEIRVLSTPDSAEGSVSYLVGRRVFTGEVLSVRGSGRGPGQSDPSEGFESVVKILFSLPDETFVYPTHDEGGFSMTTIGAERRFNPDVVNRNRASLLM